MVIFFFNIVLHLDQYIQTNIFDRNQVSSNDFKWVGTYRVSCFFRETGIDQFNPIIISLCRIDFYIQRVLQRKYSIYYF